MSCATVDGVPPDLPIYYFANTLHKLIIKASIIVVHKCAHHWQGYMTGVVEWESGQISPMRSEPIMWSNDTRNLLALCNDLTPLSQDKVTGPEDEVKIFKKVEAAFVVSDLGLWGCQSAYNVCECFWWCMSPSKLPRM